MIKKVRLGEVCSKASSNIAQKDLENVDGEYPIYGASGFIKNVNFYQREEAYVAVVKDGAGIGRIMKLPEKSSVIGTLQYIIPNEDIDINYLAYAMEYMNLSKYFTGATIPHIYFKDYQKEEIPLRTIEEQRKIAEKLDKVSDLIEKRKQQLEKLDELVKSRFVELFGDVSLFTSIPLEKSVEEMFIGPFGSSLKNECFVAAEEGYCMVYEQKHAIRKTMDVATRYVDEEKYKELRRFSVMGGDIIVSCRGTIGETYIVPEDAPLGIMHPSIMKIRLRDTVYNKVFFNHLLQNVLKKHESEANGSGIKMAITATALGKETFIVPSLDLQNEFVTFVEQTDKSKLAIQKSLDKLETLKKALMQQYFG